MNSFIDEYRKTNKKWLLHFWPSVNLRMGTAFHDLEKGIITKWKFQTALFWGGFFVNQFLLVRINVPDYWWPFQDFTLKKPYLPGFSIWYRWVSLRRNIAPSVMAIFRYPSRVCLRVVFPGRPSFPEHWIHADRGHPYRRYDHPSQ